MKKIAVLFATIIAIFVTPAISFGADEELRVRIADVIFVPTDPGRPLIFPDENPDGLIVFLCNVGDAELRIASGIVGGIFPNECKTFPVNARVKLVVFGVNGDTRAAVWVFDRGNLVVNPSNQKHY